MKAFLELWKILREKVFPITKFYYHIFYRETTWSTFIGIVYWNFKISFEIRIKVPARQLRTTISATVLFPCSRIWIWRAQCLFRNEDKIAKRRSCGRQYNVFLYSVSSVATLRTPFPRNLSATIPTSAWRTSFEKLARRIPPTRNFPLYRDLQLWIKLLIRVSRTAARLSVAWSG